MAMKSSLMYAMREAAIAIRGSSVTRRSRIVTCGMFVEVMRKGGYQIHSPLQIGGRHLAAYVAARRAKKIETRTLQTEMSHLRGILRKVGKTHLAGSKEYSNDALGISGGSRKGKKTPMKYAELQAAKARCKKLRRYGFALLLELEFYLGLRGMEAIRANRTELLAWRQSLLNDQPIHVCKGCKGGRPRDTNVPEKAEALTAIDHAIEHLRQQGGGFLVRLANGKEATLEQAERVYRAFMNRLQVIPHSARYRFAMVRLMAYMAAGLPEKLALRRTALDLGHGSGRGRWAKSVYCACWDPARGPLDPQKLEDLFK